MQFRLVSTVDFSTSGGCVSSRPHSQHIFTDYTAELLQYTY